MLGNAYRDASNELCTEIYMNKDSCVWFTQNLLFRSRGVSTTTTMAQRDTALETKKEVGT